ncbi:MAG: hypothetical protein JWL82_484 [Parcubacteria group bacterium]|nr:hypothetical protein [Parcubacteria group bacterium]
MPTPWGSSITIATLEMLAVPVSIGRDSLEASELWSIVVIKPWRVDVGVFVTGAGDAVVGMTSGFIFIAGEGAFVGRLGVTLDGFEVVATVVVATDGVKAAGGVCLWSTKNAATRTMIAATRPSTALLFMDAVYQMTVRDTTKATSRRLLSCLLRVLMPYAYRLPPRLSLPKPAR